MKNIGILFLAILMVGCAHGGFDRGSLQSQMGVKKPVFDDKEIKDAYNKKPNLPKPFKLAVYFVPARGSIVDWRWTDENKTAFDEIAKDLKSKGLVSDVFPILNSLVKDDDIHSLRLAAAKHGADAILVIHGVAQLDRYMNGWGVTYALILPTLFVKGSEVETIFMINASMWDVKNEYLYLTAESEATTKDTYAAAFGKRDSELVDEAKTKAVEKLRDQLKTSMMGQK